MTATWNQEAFDTFGQKLIGTINGAGLALMLSLGHRSGLLDCLATLPPATSQMIADAAKLNERYVREWLGAMTTGGVVQFNPADGTYHLPAEHAGWLTRAASPNNLAASMQWVAVLGHVEDHVLEAFRHGRGVPYSAYHRFHEVMAEESAQTVVAALFEHILPLATGLLEQLENGIDVLDIGCGSGLAIIELAERFPNSRFVGYDASPEAIATAASEANRRALTNAHFEIRDVAALQETAKYDLITAFDAIHDQAKPDAVLRNIASALKPQGTYLMQDISGSSHIHTDKEHLFGPFLYTISCMHCMSVSLAAGGPGLGAMWGKEVAARMLADAGFTKVRIESLAHDPLNFFYVCQK
jgi:2-polyprenyl-3-methyl-5-hydroxy-6-metoxy-1,4-benzoquinol methylase